MGCWLFLNGGAVVATSSRAVRGSSSAHSHLINRRRGRLKTWSVIEGGRYVARRQRGGFLCSRHNVMYDLLTGPLDCIIILLLLVEGDHEGVDLGPIHAFIWDTLINRSSHDYFNVAALLVILLSLKKYVSMHLLLLPVSVVWWVRWYVWCMVGTMYFSLVCEQTSTLG
jgi:hypothetical protein